ncbi:MAG: bifunctional diaminohydroxyphosphoribosylaminopyrimidine deaminase/5-amino-6-(5-phosphoribosylamino)uracil reductase RibD [Xanthobacteraceae bacterium]
MSTPGSVAASDAVEDRRFMALALALGRRGLGRTWPNPAVGAVVVKNGEVVGRGWTQPGGRPHAEAEALRRAGVMARGGTLYVTLEPCSHHGKSPPCADAVIASAIARVVSAMEDPNPEVGGRGHARLRSAGIAVDVGIEAATARRDHAGHIRRMRDGRPHVILKLAISTDGKVAGGERRRVAITGNAVRDRVHLMRAHSDAIMIGIGTALADDPVLTCRLPGMDKMSPTRVVLDCGLRLPIQSRLVATARETPLWMIAGKDASVESETALCQSGAHVMRVTEKNGRLDLREVLRLLATRGITRLMVEGGPTVASALIAADLIDEAVFFHSPMVIGEAGMPALDPRADQLLKEQLKCVASESIGPDRQDSYDRGSDHV